MQATPPGESLPADKVLSNVATEKAHTRVLVYALVSPAAVAVLARQQDDTMNGDAAANLTGACVAEADDEVPNKYVIDLI